MLSILVNIFLQSFLGKSLRLILKAAEGITMGVKAKNFYYCKTCYSLICGVPTDKKLIAY